MTLTPLDEKQNVLKIIYNSNKQAYWTSNVTRNHCVVWRLVVVEGVLNASLDLIRLNIRCSSKRHSICYRTNSVSSDIGNVEDDDYDCDCEL